MTKIRRKILGVNVDFGYSIKDVVTHVDKLIKKSDKTYLVSTTNPYFIMAAQEDREFKDIVNDAELSVPDGVGVLYANYFLETVKKLPKNVFLPFTSFIVGIYCGISGYFNRSLLGSTITGVDLSEELFKLANREGYSLYFLGGGRRDKKGNVMIDNSYDLATHAMNIVKKKYPNIRIAGSSSAFKKESAYDKETISYIHNDMHKNKIDKIDILLVAYNPVGQEKWIQRNAVKLPATVCIGIGRTFNYITNDMRKPPVLYDKLHIAWLYAFMLQSWRFRRVFMSFPIFPLKVYLDSIKSSS